MEFLSFEAIFHQERYKIFHKMHEKDVFDRKMIFDSKNLVFYFKNSKNQ